MCTPCCAVGGGGCGVGARCKFGEVEPNACVHEVTELNMYSRSSTLLLREVMGL